MDATVITAIIGAGATIITAIIGAMATRAKEKTNVELKKEWAEYKNAVSRRESYLDVDYGIRIVSPKDGGQVGQSIEVTGVYNIMPPPKTLRLFVVNPEKTNHGERFWPQEIVTDFFPETKAWQAKVNIGAPPSEIKWGIIAAVVGPSTIVLYSIC